MSKFDHINRKLYGYMIKRLGLREYRNGWVKGDCPNCGKADKFGVQVQQNRSNCFVCGYNPKPIDLVVEYEKLSSRGEAWAFLRSFQGISLSLPVVEELTELQKKHKHIELPKEYLSLGSTTSTVEHIVTSYLSKRGFSKRELQLWGVGFCVEGDYANRVIIPYYHLGKLVYFSARKFTAIGVKFKNPPESMVGVGKAVIMYNVDALYIYQRVHIVESAMNCWTIGDNAIGLGGKVASKHQVSAILRSPVKECIIALDPDAKAEAIRLALRLVKTKRVKLIDMPGDQDVNDIGRLAYKLLVASAEYLSYGQLLKMNHEVRNA